MTWLELFYFLDRQYNEAFDGLVGKCPKVPALPDAKAADVREQLQLLESETDLACHVFAAERRWPIMRPEVAWQVLWRLQQCRAFAKFVGCPDIPDKYATTSLPDEYLLRWVLCEFWKVAGIARRMRHLSSDTLIDE